MPSRGLVFVTAFPDRKTFLRFFGEIAWETEVWIAESPGQQVTDASTRGKKPRKFNQDCTILPFLPLSRRLIPPS